MIDGHFENQSCSVVCDSLRKTSIFPSLSRRPTFPAFISGAMTGRDGE
jgi:hypothetical protein